jgi:hypothetical protein
VSAATTLLGVLLALAEPAAADSLRTCDHLALELEPAERDYACYARVARSPGATATIEHVAALTERHPDDGRLWLTLGALQADFGHDPKAAFTQAIDALVAVGERRYEIQARLNLARWFSNEGDAALAGAQLEAARASAEQLDHPVLTAIVEFDALGEAARHLDTDLLAAYRRALAAYEDLEPDAPPQVLRAGGHMLARGARVLGNDRRAASFAQASADASTQAGDTHGALHARRAVALDRYRFQSQNHDPAARARFRAEAETLLAEADAQDNPLVRISLLQDLARTSPPAQRAAAFSRCLTTVERLEMRVGQCRRGLARALAKRDPDRARRLLDDAFTDAATEGSSSTLSLTHAVAASLALAQGDAEQAWVSWSAMFDAAEASTDEQPADARLRLHARWSPRYRWVAGEALRRADAPRWVARGFDAMERMRGRELAEYAGHETSERVRLDDVVAALPDDTAMLLFQVAPALDRWGEPNGGSWLLVVHGGGTAAYPLPDAAQLEPAIGMVAAQLAGDDSDASAALYDTLLAGPLAALPDSIRTLVVLPDGELHRLPLGALQGPDGMPLRSRYSISVESSATAWHRGRERGALPRRFVAFADPAPRKPGAVRLAARTRGNALGRLPGARAESSYAAEVLGGRARVLLDANATESALREATDAAIVHIGAHVIVDGLEPANTRLLLASDASSDGDVFLEELADLDLDGPLVVLAACEGADGELLAGEGPLSAVRALQLAGARTVVAGLWPVDDGEASALFAAFYEALDRGETVAAALAAAQAERAAAGAPISSWAGFVVYGDGGARLEPRRRPRPWHLALLAGVFVAAGAWFESRRR